MHVSKIIIAADHFPVRDKHPFNLPVFSADQDIALGAPTAFLVGENGAGKSTLLEALARRCNIHIWREPDNARLQPNPYEDLLFKFIKVIWTDGPTPGSFFSSEIFRDFTRHLEGWALADPGVLKYFGGKSLVTQSHGQALKTFFTARFAIKGLYLLDEPEAGLSPASQMDLLRVIHRSARAGRAQFIIATHSPILLACPGAEIFSLDQAPIERIPYEQTTYYRVFKDFLDNRQKYLDQLDRP
jgi:predicted ATPase